MTSPLGAVFRGLVAGAAGTLVMTGTQELASRLQSSAQEGQEEPPADPWEQASAPAQVARRVIEGVFDRHAPPESIPLLTNAMHWGYGTGWGAIYGLVQATKPGPVLRRGLLFGAGVLGMSYVQLVPMGLYEPPWRYSPKDLGTELGFHLAFGAATAVAYAALDR